jgi:hypothetical protein
MPSAVLSAVPVSKGETEGSEREPSADDQQAAQRRRLEAKVAAGKASPNEMEALFELCVRQRDAACSRRVEAAMRRGHE